MRLGISTIKGQEIYVDRRKTASIAVSGQQAQYDVPDYLDWHWFSDNGFLDTETIIDPVTQEKAWEWIKSIESVTLDSSVIGEFAFDGCSTLQTVTLSDKTRSIGESAFYKCTNLQTIEGLDNVTSLGNWAFDRCTRLQLTHVPPNLIDMGYGAFANCENFTGDITIPSGVHEIGEQTFVNCIGLNGMTIHSGVNWIGENAFQGCVRISRITFQGKSLDYVRSMENYPWGVDESIIEVA